MIHSVRFHWDAMPRTIRYEFQIREVGTPAWGPVQQALTNYIDQLLEDGKSYEWRVRSVCPRETTAWKTAGASIYNNDNACTAPTGIAVEQIPNTYNFRVYWDNTANAQVWNFRYRRQGELAWISSVQNSPEITLSNLVIGAYYEFQVQKICVGNTTSGWSNISSFLVRSNTATQDCPISYEEDWGGTLNGRKDSGDTVKLNGTLNFIGAAKPEADSYVDAGSIGQCCAPLQDLVFPVDNAQFKGEVTITAAGQIVVYIELYKGAPAISYTFSNQFYQSYTATCPPPVPPGPAIHATATFTLPPGSGSNQHMTMNLQFNTALAAGITFKWGFCVINNANPGFNYCYGFPGASHDGDGSDHTQAVIGIGATSYTQQSNYPTTGASASYITKIYVYDLVGIARENFQLAVGQNYQLIFL